MGKFLFGMVGKRAKHFGRLLKYTSHCGTYGTRYSKWKYDFATGEFVFNTFEQIEKHIFQHV